VEFSTLFASLARAAGIPTRIVFGEALNGKNWVGHMWCEVWLGEWIAVDAAAGIFVETPSHIKFIDSPTVMGTQKIRWKLVDNLGIDILAFQKKTPHRIQSPGN
jgi:transglutaminase-like putative cysteine protease